MRARLPVIQKTASAVLLWLAVAALPAQQPSPATPATPTDRLLAAGELTAIDAIDTRPWHLKLDVTIFDDKGANPQQGTVEVWRSGPQVKTVTTLGASTATRLVIDNKVYRTSTGPEIPYRMEEILEHVLHPGPDVDEVKNSKPEVRKQSFGPVSLDCIMLTQPMPRVAYPPLGLFPTYCLSTGPSLIRVSFNFGGQTVSVNGSGKFMDHQVATAVQISEGKVVVSTAKVTTLSTFAPRDDEFAPPPGVTPYSGTARISGGILSGNILSKTSPIYPDSAKANHVSGTVVLHVIIGRDGRVHSLRPVSSPDPDLTLSAIAAVRKWIYKPYLLNGEPTDVDSTITVNYSLSPQ